MFVLYNLLHKLYNVLKKYSTLLVVSYVVFSNVKGNGNARIVFIFLLRCYLVSLDAFQR